MELPKNITQIGEMNHGCRIYVEDYVISYIKQVNVHARDKTMAVAVYGSRKEEAGVTYLFFYGACRLNFLTRESRHLSQAVQQEAEELRQKFFQQYEFLGYCMLNGEMVEGFQICQQGVCRYISGYAQFYEKNDCMLAFMLESRKEAAKPEEVDQEKYNEVKKRQEDRKLQSKELSKAKVLHLRDWKPDIRNGAKNLRTMKYAAAAVFLLLCVAGVASLSGENGLENLQVAARQILESINTKQLPDVEKDENKSVLVVTDELKDEVYKEGMAGSSGPDVQAATSNGVTVPTGEPDTSLEGTQTPEDDPEWSVEPPENGSPDPGPESVVTSDTDPGSIATPDPGSESVVTPTPESTVEPTQEPTAEPVSYIVQKNDTLIGICIKIYGSADKVKEVCDFNNIPDADNIKAGQKIFLP